MIMSQWIVLFVIPAKGPVAEVAIDPQLWNAQAVWLPSKNILSLSSLVVDNTF